MDVRGWLIELGLGEYAEAFAANHIDEAILRELAPEDLRELGMASLGHRKRLLEAIAALRTRPARASGSNQAERRQVVVLFADICGFTELSASVDAEDVRRIVEQFLTRADEIMAEHGGTVDKHIGDATMALFGAPVAHDDDALRAVAAAAALQHAMPALSRELGRPMETHVGIAIGDVVAGEIGSSVRRDYTVLGDTVNLASRLVGEAGPGETVMSAEVWRAVANRMHATSLGERTLKGIAQPQQLWRLEGPREGASIHRLPFVGRELELAQAIAVLSTARPGAFIHIRGEAGIGKSRLLAETVAEAERRGFGSILVRVLDFGAARRQSPLEALVDQLAVRCPDWRADPSLDSSVRAALHDALGEPFPAELAAPYFAMEDSRRSALRVRAVVELAAVAAARTPLAIAFEDLHWASDVVRALAGALGRQCQHLHLVLLTTSRIEGDPVDAGFRRELNGAPLAVVELGPLRAEALRRLTETTLARADRAMVSLLAARSGGNPLFLEQLLANAAEGSRSLPTTIRALVQARLDRLDPGTRSALQAASVLGQRFALPALRALVPQADQSIRSLIDIGLLARDGDGIVFPHALIQEATYASLLGEAARTMHRLAADWQGESELELRAFHLDRANDRGAADAYRQAAEHLRAGGNLAAALEHAERGFQLVQTAADDVRLRLLLGHLKLELGSAREALAQYEAVLTSGPDIHAAAEATFGVASSLRIVDDMAGAARALDRAQATAEANGLTALQSRCHYLRGNLLFPAGKVEECMAEHRQALALAEREQSPELVARALGGLADGCYARGQMRSALSALERCIENARQAGAGAVEIANRPMLGFAQCCMMNLDAMHEAGLTARTMARQAQNRRAEIIALHVLMLVAWEADRPQEGLPYLPAARQIVAELGAWRFEGENVIFGAQLEAAAGRKKEAIEMAREAVALCREHARSYFAPAALGIGAALTDDPAERAAWLAEGEAGLAGPTLVHNHLFFRRNAIDAVLAAGKSGEARRHAAALADYTAHEPLPLTDLIVRRAELLADALDGRLTPEKRAELSRLAATGQQSGFVQLAKAMLAAG
jgi:class 3 adenylate cyclase/tetratricopeptide (TPR) repeat protein